MDNELLDQAEDLLERIEEFAQDIDYARSMLFEHMRNYAQEPSNPNRIELQSSIAYIKNYLEPRGIFSQALELQESFDLNTLELRIEGRWRAFEFRQLFQSVDYLSKAFTVGAKLNRNSPDVRLQRGVTRAAIYRKARLYYYLTAQEELRVSKIDFASPGGINFEGIGEIIKELRETVDYVITGTWIKHVVDNYFAIRDREQVRRVEEQARRADALARKAEADARRAEATLKEIEATSKIRAAVQQTMESIDDPGALANMKEGTVIIYRLADTGVRLQANRLADLTAYEDSVMNSLATLYRLSHEEGKLRGGK